MRLQPRCQYAAVLPDSLQPGDINPGEKLGKAVP
jgi:hypothetical protein